MLGRVERISWWVLLVLNAMWFVGRYMDGTSKWGIAISGFFVIIAMLVLRRDYLLRHPDEPVA